MTKLKTLDDLKDLTLYKKDLKADLALLKETPTALSWVEMFQFNGGKREAAVLLGAVPDSLEKAIKAAGKAIKVGKCKRNKADEVEIVSGGLKPGLLAALFKTLGMDEKVCATVGGATGGIDDDTAEAVGTMVKDAEKPSDAQATQIADTLTDRYEALQKTFGPVFTEAKRRQYPTDALVKAELEIEKALKRRAVEIAADADEVGKKIQGYEQIGRSLAAMIQRERDQDSADKKNGAVADALTEMFEAMQKKLDAVRVQAQRLKLAEDKVALMDKAENAAEAELKKSSTDIVANADKVKKLIADFGQAGKNVLDAIAEHKQKQEDARRREEERDRQLLEGVGKKKDVPKQAPRKVQGANAAFKPLDLGPAMTFKEKFRANMVRAEGDVVKHVNGSDRDGGFSTYYTFAQGDDLGAYEIHIHRDAAGDYKFGQVKPGRKAKVNHGGEDRIFRNELATYGIPFNETPPT